MNDDVRTLLHDLVDGVPVGRPPIEAITSDAPRRPRGWWAPLVAAAAVALVLAGVWLLPKAAPHPPVSLAPARGWQELPTPPLSPRDRAIGAYVDGKVVIVGGSSSTFSGGPFIGNDLRDGAVYDPATRTWRTMPDVPRSLQAWSYTSVVAGTKLVLPMQRRGWLVYDAADDAWSALPAPPGHPQQVSLAADDRHVYAVTADDVELHDPVMVLDLATLRWTTLPMSPEAASLERRELVHTDEGLVLLGHPGPSAGHPWGQPRAVALVWDGHRWSRSDAAGLEGRDWHWTGKRIVPGYRLTAREAKRDRKLQAGAFDPEAGTWSALPWLPRRWNEAAGGREATAYGPKVFAWGYLWDDETRTQTRIENPGPWTGGTAVVTDRALIVVGGSRLAPGQDPAARVARIQVTNKAWILPLD